VYTQTSPAQLSFSGGGLYIPPTPPLNQFRERRHVLSHRGGRGSVSARARLIPGAKGRVESMIRLVQEAEDRLKVSVSLLCGA